MSKFCFPNLVDFGLFLSILPKKRGQREALVESAKKNVQVVVCATYRAVQYMVVQDECALPWARGNIS
jgi:hypothetical protein